ncbi:MAG: tRNA pseudouridine(55) synthase TruB [Bacteroidetes bacterium]|nr:tRNA pseudouridine(55) synthase TruB [Bacteroidota bacterium]
MRRGELPPEGALLLVDKPAGWTSFDVVAKSRNLLGVRKVGHTGTLDPMATGLLILCLGRATKLADLLQAEEKEYTGTIVFGATTPTDDADSEPNEYFPTDHLTLESIAHQASRFLGTSMQRAPIYSARKVNGTRLYSLARRGEEVEIPEKPITIQQFDILPPTLTASDSSPTAVRFVVVCSKGTYIRALARDLGKALGSGAYLTELRRTRSGRFLVDNAVTMPELIEAMGREQNSSAP